MKAIKQLSDAIDKHREKISQIETEIDRANGIMPATTDETDLSALRETRRRMRGQAFVEQKTVDTTAIDSEIALLQKRVDSTREQAETVAAGLEILKTRLEEARTEEQRLLQARRNSVVAVIAARHALVMKSYVALVDQLGGVVAELVALERGLASYDPNSGKRTDLHSAEIFKALQQRGLAVPPQFAVPPPYPDITPPNAVGAPPWLDTTLEKFALKETRKLGEELAVVGA
jgi:hypothetical protein